MKSYRITLDQKLQIEKQPFSAVSFFNPVKDINGAWFIFEIEMEAAVLNKSWNRVTLADYVSPISTEPKISEL